jgi:hypothetical protein
MEQSSKALLAGMLIASSQAATAGWSQNLFVNPGNELPLFNGAIPGWTVVSGSWGQRSDDPEPYEGSFYFAAQPGAPAVLKQRVDLYALFPSHAIDGGWLKIGFAVHGGVAPPGSTYPYPATMKWSRITETGWVTGWWLDGYDQREGWQPSYAPWNGTVSRSERYVEVELYGHLGRFDGLLLQYMPATVPEPAIGSMALAGVLLVGGAARVVRRRQS